MSIWTYLLSLGPTLWLIVAVALFAAETLIPGIHLLWFGVAAVATAIVALMLGLSWPGQIATFAVLSVVAMLLVRRFALQVSNTSDQPGLNNAGSQYVGRVVIVEEAIRGGRGKVRVGDTIWIAEGADAAPGQRVRVAKVSGSVLSVEPE